MDAHLVGYGSSSDEEGTSKKRGMEAHKAKHIPKDRNVRKHSLSPEDKDELYEPEIALMNNGPQVAEDTGDERHTDRRQTSPTNKENSSRSRSNSPNLGERLPGSDEPNQSSRNNRSKSRSPTSEKETRSNIDEFGRQIRLPSKSEDEDRVGGREIKRSSSRDQGRSRSRSKSHDRKERRGSLRDDKDGKRTESRDTSPRAKKDRSPRKGRDSSPGTSPRKDRSPRKERSPRKDRSPRRERSPRRDRNRRRDRSPRNDRSPRKERSPRRGNRSPRRDRSPRRADRSPRRGGGRSPKRGGDRSPKRGGDRSPRRGGDRSPKRGGDRSPKRGGDRSPKRGGDRSPRRSGDRSPKKRRSSRSWSPDRPRDRRERKAIYLGGPAKPIPQPKEKEFMSSEEVMKKLAQRQESLKHEAQANAATHNLPSYLNPSVVNPQLYAKQQEKRKLLWSSKKNDETPTNTAVWSGTKFTGDQGGEMGAKFRRLMGIKGEGTADAEDDGPTKGDQILTDLEKEFERSRAFQLSRGAGGKSGIGLGYAPAGYNQ